MRNDKRARMMAEFGKDYPEVTKAVFNQIPEELVNKLTGKELGMIMALMDNSYHAGKKSCGAEVDGDGIWIDKLGKMYDLEDIKKLG